MNRIVILGCAGAGKSTLAKALGKKLNIEVIHLDCLYWKEGWQKEDFEVFCNNQRLLVEKEKWIMDGNFRDSLDIRLSKADTVIYLDYNRFVCLFSVIRRYFKYHKRQRTSLAKGCNDKINVSFINWVWNFKKNSKPIIIDKINKHENLTVHYFKTRKKLQKFIDNILYE